MLKILLILLSFTVLSCSKETDNSLSTSETQDATTTQTITPVDKDTDGSIADTGSTDTPLVPKDQDDVVILKKDTKTEQKTTGKLVLEEDNTEGGGLLDSVTVIPDNSPITPVCNRTPAIQKAISKQINLSCEQITNQRLLQIAVLPLKGQNITSLKQGDFDGLSNLKRINLFDNQLPSVPEGIFNGLKKLKHIILSSNRLTNLPEGIFKTNKKLILVDLSYNELRTIPHDTFSVEVLPKLRRLYLQQNNFTVDYKDNLNDRMYEGRGGYSRWIGFKEEFSEAEFALQLRGTKYRYKIEEANYLYN